MEEKEEWLYYFAEPAEQVSRLSASGTVVPSLVSRESFYSQGREWDKD